MDIIRNLPLEIAQYVLLFLDPNAIDTVWNSIEEWRGIISNNNFWKKVCQRNGYQENDYCLSSNIYKEYMLKCAYDWQAIYKYHRLLNSNWRCGNFKSISLGSKTKYDDINYFDDEVVVASVFGFPNNKTDIINSTTGTIYLSLNQNSVQEARKHQDLIIFIIGNTLKVWNLKSTSWILNLEIEQDRLLYIEGYHHLEISDNLLALVNARCCLRIFNLETKKLCFADLNVVDVSFGDNFVIYLSFRKEVNVLDLDFKILVSEKYGERSEIENVKIKGGYVICLHKTENPDLREVFVYAVEKDTKSLREIRSISVSYQRSCFLNDDTLLFWNSKESKYYLWKFATENHTVTIHSKDKRMDLVVGNKFYMFICNEESILKMWCSKTGEFIRCIQDASNISFEVTEKKLAYLTADGSLYIQNYDFVEEEN